MSIYSLTLRSLFTPRLYAIYNTHQPNAHYQPNELEKWTNKIISSIAILWKMSQYASPLIGIYLYKNDMLSGGGILSMMRLASVFSMTLIVSYIVRGIGRAKNPQYQTFVDAFRAPETRRGQLLRNFDYDFDAVPVSYYAQKKLPEPRPSTSPTIMEMSAVDLFGAVVVKLFGLRLIYPGSLTLIHNALWPELLRGRKHLVETENGVRHKIRTTDGNDIDCMLVDNRSNDNRNGTTLVVCCEGNSGFYEVGLMTTPLSSEYSVLGWNHPGFGGSTGSPYPDQERRAIEALMEFATDRLDFDESNIVVFGWSIGGYTAAYAAFQYQQIKCLFLDATFDDLLPLATARMPPSWAPLVRSVVSRHVPLNVGELAARFPGDFRVVRRSSDEIICLREGDPSTNCGNPLIIRLFRAHYPELMTEDMVTKLTCFLALQSSARKNMLASMLNHSDNNIKTLFKLVNKHLVDYDSTHCTNLPRKYFNIENGY